MIASSRSSHGMQCATSGAFGSRLSGGRALTTLVIQTSSRTSPAAASSSPSSLPARPTNGRPSSSSVAPGASPTNITGAAGLPSPGTIRDAVVHGSKPHPVWARISSRKLSSAVDTGCPLIDEAALHGPARQFVPRGELQLAQHGRHVRFDGLGGDPQAGGDLLVEVAAGDVPEDLALARGELVELG